MIQEPVTKELLVLMLWRMKLLMVLTEQAIRRERVIIGSLSGLLEQI